MVDLFLSLRRRLFGRGKPRPKHYWDSSFADGRWDYLDSEEEAPRFDALAALVEKHASPGGRILDLGCGTATLWRRLAPDTRPSYVGMDISSEALSRARDLTGGGAILVRGPAAAEIPPAVAALGPFAVVVMSEVLYYLDDPIEVLASYETILADDGRFIISLWNPRRHRALRARLHRHLEVRETVVVDRAGGAPWELWVARPRERATNAAV